MNPQFSPVPAETFHVRSDKIDQQQGAYEMATRQNWNLESAPLRRPPHKHALEITLLHLVDPKMDLREGANKNQRHHSRQTNDAQLHRCKNIDDFAQHISSAT